MDQLNNPKLRKTASSLSILSKTRKISQELQRPLKRATSLSYRVFTPTNMVIPTSLSSNSLSAHNHSINEPNTETLGNFSTRASKATRRFRSLRKLKIKHAVETPSTSPIGNFTSSAFEVNLISPPSSPRHLQDENDDEEESTNESETSVFSNDYNNYTEISCETSPITKRDLRFKPILGDLSNSLFPDELDHHLWVFQESASLRRQSKNCHRIFQIPEILELILRHVSHDYTSNIPVEPKLKRRPPLSYNHSLILYGEEDGEKIWKRTKSGEIIPTKQRAAKNPNVHNCLLVNKLWNFTMLSILNENLYFENTEKFKVFASSLDVIKKQHSLQPFSIVLHKIKTSQSSIEHFSSAIDPYRLSWLEMYICQSILPSMKLITSALEKLILPGCTYLTDDYLSNIIFKTPNLKTLDIRACDQITDTSLYYISQHCPQLEVLNCGRHRRGELITDISIGQIARNCPLKTIGIAGCGISDWSIWEIALNCSATLERLSVNYCWKLTDSGICKVLKTGMLDGLKVLEIRGLNIENVEELVYWERRSANKGNRKVLIEACERIDRMIYDFQKQLHLEINRNILSDLGSWLEQSDSDIDHSAFLRRFADDL
ncbi:unnamed protein product [Pichia kudriavzevii]